jgi:hypothetical protein
MIDHTGNRFRIMGQPGPLTFYLGESKASHPIHEATAVQERATCSNANWTLS